MELREAVERMTLRMKQLRNHIDNETLHGVGELLETEFEALRTLIEHAERTQNFSEALVAIRTLIEFSEQSKQLLLDAFYSIYAN